MQSPILLFGPPVSVQGTPSTRLADTHRIQHVTTGDALRANKKMDITDLETKYDTPGEYMDAGELVPDTVVNTIVKEALSEADGYVLDGYPRNLEQAKILDSITELDYIIALEVPESDLLVRLTGRRVCPECGETYHTEFEPPAETGICTACGAELTQREDDTEETVKERLSVFAENTEPVIEYYDERNELTRVSGQGNPEEVFTRLTSVIEDD